MAAAVAQAPLPATTPFQTPSTATKPTIVPGTRRDIHTQLNFHKDNEDGSPPHPTYVDKPETFYRPYEAHNVVIQDVTGREKEFTLDGHGFQFVRSETSEKEFLDDEKIKAVYYPEVEKLLKETTGASRVHIFDHTIRRQLPETEGTSQQTRTLRGPVQRVHIDQSYSASLSRVPHHLPDEAETLLKGRVQIINVWRPLKTITRDPLTVAKASTVLDEDLVATALIYPTRKGETYSVRYNPGQEWYYKNELTPQEALLIKCFDSKVDGRARRVPHSAFVDPDGYGPARESIELRVLVFHPEDTE